MRIPSGNIRGAGSKGFLAQLKHLLSFYKPDVIALMETKVNSSKARIFISRVNFLNSTEFAPEGYSGEI